MFGVLVQRGTQYLISNDDIAAVVTEALRIGYRHIDTAQGYFNEEGIGEAIEIAVANGIVAREELYITTKLWPGNQAWGDAPKGYDEVVAACEKSLEKLKLSCIDLYLIHAPFAHNHRLEQWEALIHLQKIGKVKDIGVCNYNIHHLEEIKSKNLQLPVINQVELHPWSQKPALMDYMKKNAIHAMAYSSLAPLSTWRQAPGQDSAKTDQMKREGESSASPFKQIAQKHNVSESQVLLRWGVQQQIPVIPKSTNVQRMKQNLDVFSFELDAEDMAILAKQDKGDGVAWVSGDPSRFDK